MRNFQLYWIGGRIANVVKKYGLKLQSEDGIDPDDVIMSPDKARQEGLSSTVVFPTGNIAPQGSIIKATAIDPDVVDENQCVSSSWFCTGFHI